MRLALTMLDHIVVRELEHIHAAATARIRCFDRLVHRVYARFEQRIVAAENVGLETIVEVEHVEAFFVRTDIHLKLNKQTNKNILSKH